MKLPAALCLAMVPAGVLAADTDALNDGAGMLRGLLGLGFVIALILVAGWLLRRLSPQHARAGGPLRIVATQALGARERVVLLEIADQWLVIGVAPGRVQSIATLPRAALPPAALPTSGGFSALLARARGRDKTDGA